MAFIEITRVNDKYIVMIKDEGEYSTVGEFNDVYINGERIEEPKTVFILSNAIITVFENECYVQVK